jgi:Uncharacterized protein conserved in bacteria (DUF2330)
MPCQISPSGVFTRQSRLIQGSSKFNRQILFMKNSRLLLLALLIAVPLMPANVRADGMFVAPKFVWDKHKDINEPTQKAIMVYDAGREDLILQVKYEGPVDEFGWLIPVPNLPTVQEGSMKCFYELSQYTQEHFEPRWVGAGTLSASRGKGEDNGTPEPVKVIEIKTVGAYEIAVLSAKDSGALAKWLEANQFYFPANKTDVIDAYVKQQWYFIAVKVNLGHDVRLKLASGELHPLQISFTSDKCVFPLKISSVNGKPSEVQVYVLSSEPLLEKTMLEKKLPTIYSNDMARAAERAQQFEENQLNQRNFHRHFMGATAPDNSPLSPEGEKMVQGIRKMLLPASDELLPYARVTKVDLPECAKVIPRLEDKLWWLMKQTWTFKPEEMRDLEFEPALPFFAEELSSKYGYFADASLASFGSNSVPTIIAAMQSTNPTVRACAAGIISEDYGGYGNYGYWSQDSTLNDSRLIEPAVSWLKDSEPKVRKAGINVIACGRSWNPKAAESLVALLRDKDDGVRHFTIATLSLVRFRDDMEKYIPVFQQMLKDKNPDIQEASLQILQHLRVEIPREDLLPFFKSSDWRVLDTAYDQLRDQNEKLSDDDALVLLQNPQPVAQLLGLHVLDQNPEKQSVELALPLLRAPDESVRLKAAQTLHVLTGQHFTEDQADEWGRWWVENKTNFVVELHPEELRPKLPLRNRPQTGIP